MKHVREDKGGEGEEGGTAGWDGRSQLQLGARYTTATEKQKMWHGIVSIQTPAL